MEIVWHPNGILKDAKIFACQKMRKKGVQPIFDG